MKTDNYRVFPIFILAFTRVATGVAIGLAIPLYLIEIGLNPEIIGIIISGTAMAYLFSPLIFRNVQKKLGVKPTVIISTLGFLCIQVILQFSKDPLLIYFLLILDGTFLGLFWPVLMGALSAISNSEEYRKNTSLKDKFMKKYSLAWNFGGIFSYTLGFFVLFYIDNIQIMFIFALFFAIIGFSTALIIQEPTQNFHKEIIVPIDNGIKVIPQREHISFPIFLPLFMIGIYGFLIGGMGLIYPIKSEILSFALFTNYLFFFLRISTQTISISKSMDFKIKNIKKMIPIANLIVAISLFLMGINQNLFIYAILFCAFGIFNSFYYTLAFKLIVFRNIANNTYKYSIYFETAIGIGFFFAPILCGFIAAVDPNLAFFFLSLLSLLSLVIYLLSKNNIKTS